MSILCLLEKADRLPMLRAFMNLSIKSKWREYRSDVIAHFPVAPLTPVDTQRYLKEVDEHYVQDAYHSLSIEGYQVNQALIEKVRKAEWFPETNEEDREHKNGLAARGYYEAFLAVKQTLVKILEGGNPGALMERELPEWYRKLFAPCVAAGLVQPSDLFGYRGHQVYIRNSRQTPLPTHALRDAMDAFYSCLKEEKEACVRAILGHFIFVFIHPYMDG